MGEFSSSFPTVSIKTTHFLTQMWFSLFYSFNNNHVYVVSIYPLEHMNEDDNVFFRTLWVVWFFFVIISI